MRLTPPLLLLGFLFDPTAALCSSYLPLILGNYWRHIGVGGEHEIQTVAANTTVWGDDVFAIRFSQSTHNNGLENYWNTEADGDVLLWGFKWLPEEWGVLYDPPIRVVDAPLFVGKTWVMSVDYYLLPDTSYGGSFEMALHVYEEGVLVLPAGAFPAFGIGGIMPPVSFLSEYSLTGESVGEARGSDANDWWSWNVGRVQYHTSDLYQLKSFSVPTSTDQVTWTTIKTLFR